MNIDIIPCHKAIRKNKRHPLKPSKYYGWCLPLSNESGIVGVTKFVDEDNVIGILNHEIMHLILYTLEGIEAYCKLDRLGNQEKAWFE